MKLRPATRRPADTCDSQLVCLLNSIDKSGNTRLSVANSDDKSNGYFACQIAFWQATKQYGER
ncbi:MAG: hypothetical protein QOH49_1719 [Acidobacteriota bacterium]|jgi:hypothetical protein|nr:hypothetical protein [Acidobacteriota bacterium]